jgi:hypothetical protein
VGNDAGLLLTDRTLPMTATQTRPLLDDLTTARRDLEQATARVALGIAISIAGIVVLAVLMLAVLPSLGSAPSAAQAIGILLVAVVAFAGSAWGTDLRHAAVAQRAAALARIAKLNR